MMERAPCTLSDPFLSNHRNSPFCSTIRLSTSKIYCTVACFIDIVEYFINTLDSYLIISRQHEYAHPYRCMLSFMDLLSFPPFSCLLYGLRLRNGIPCYCIFHWMFYTCIWMQTLPYKGLDLLSSFSTSHVHCVG
jgi:hypothetical protein